MYEILVSVKEAKFVNPEISVINIGKNNGNGKSYIKKFKSVKALRTYK